MKTSDYIADFMVEHGIRHCYGFQGTMIAHLVDSICRNKNLENHVCSCWSGKGHRTGDIRLFDQRAGSC